MLYRKDDKADMLVRISLSFFSLAKVITLAKKVNKGTFETIISPWNNPEAVLEQVGLIKVKMKDLLLRYIPDLPTIPLHQVNVVMSTTLKQTLQGLTLVAPLPYEATVHQFPVFVVGTRLNAQKSIIFYAIPPAIITPPRPVLDEECEEDEWLVAHTVLDPKLSRLLASAGVDVSEDGRLPPTLPIFKKLWSPSETREDFMPGIPRDTPGLGYQGPKPPRWHIKKKYSKRSPESEQANCAFLLGGSSDDSSDELQSYTSESDEELLII